MIGNGSSQWVMVAAVEMQPVGDDSSIGNDGQ
jgi:hypothetical protein